MEGKEFFIAYAYKDKYGKIGFFNSIVPNMEAGSFTKSMIKKIEERVRLKHDWKEVTVMGFNLIDKEN